MAKARVRRGIIKEHHKAKKPTGSSRASLLDRGHGRLHGWTLPGLFFPNRFDDGHMSHYYTAGRIMLCLYT